MTPSDIRALLEEAESRAWRHCEVPTPVLAQLLDQLDVARRALDFYAEGYHPYYSEQADGDRMPVVVDITLIQGMSSSDAEKHWKAPQFRIKLGRKAREALSKLKEME